ncbi:MAG: anthranilate synthase component I family protein, partial [archaeon]
DFDYASEFKQDKKNISGKVKKKENNELSEEESAKLTNISFVIKTILGKFESKSPYAGLYGVFAYDFAKNFYKVKEKLPDPMKEKDFELFLPTKIYVMYDNEKRAEEVDFYFNGEKFPSEKLPKGFELEKVKGEIEQDLSDEGYMKIVQKAIDDIKKGRGMQCVLSRNTIVPIKRHPFESYTDLRETNPAPYSFYYNLGENEILYGASPELHIRIDVIPDGKRLQMRPIAGTIKRSANPLEDAENRIQLLNDEKEKREHTMLVDLARHEIYKLCDAKSVQVTDLYTIENYPNLYHIVSGVQGLLKKDKDAIDALLVTLPAGTLSGAPKQEAMNMIEEYEGSKRGFYGGASGVVLFNGGCNTGVTIRCVHVMDGKSHIRSGAGVVALSSPEGELKETKLKMSKAMGVLGAKK